MKTKNKLIDKRAELLALAKLRQKTRWPGYKCIGDYHGGVYECDFVSPYTKSAGNTNAEIMVMLQDWASDGILSGLFHEPSARLGHTPSRPTNRNLTKLLDRVFELTLRDIYATNLFPFVKLGGMSQPISQLDLIAAARQFALPQIRIVNPKLVICLGLVTFNALRRACGLTPSQDLDNAIESPFTTDTTRVWCQAHTGRLSNRGGFERVVGDWIRMKEDVYGKKAFRQSDQRGVQMMDRVTTRPLAIKGNKMKVNQSERESGRSTAREPIVCFNSSGGKNHAYLYGKNAFFDLWPTDRQASNARDLHPGQTCIVAKPEGYGDISFSWFEFLRRGDGEYEGKPCWVFYGDLIKPPVRLQKAVAARTEPYSIFFNVNGHFKRQSVLLTGIKRTPDFH